VSTIALSNEYTVTNERWWGRRTA